MAALGSVKPTPPVDSGARRRSMLGWIGVGLLTLVDSVLALFAAAEGLGGHALKLADFLLHFTQLAVILGIGLAAVIWPKAGAAILIIPGIFFTVVAIGAGKLVGLVLLCAAGLFYWGRPEPKRLAYWIACGIPVAVGLVVGIVAWFQPG
jgi:hypothetical protein